MGFFTKIFSNREKSARQALGILREMLFREGVETTFDFILTHDDLMNETFTKDLVGTEGPLHHEYWAFMKELQKQMEDKYPDLKKHQKLPFQLPSGVTLYEYDIESLENNSKHNF